MIAAPLGHECRIKSSEPIEDTSERPSERANPQFVTDAFDLHFRFGTVERELGWNAHGLRIAIFENPRRMHEADPRSLVPPRMYIRCVYIPHVTKMFKLLVRDTNRAHVMAERLIKFLNRSGSIDSELSLDADGLARESSHMIVQPYRLYIERKDASKNMARFYALSIEPTLFGDVCLVRRWGRIGARGQRMEHNFPREEEAVSLFLDLLRQKRQRGYRPRRN